MFTAKGGLIYTLVLPITVILGLQFSVISENVYPLKHKRKNTLCRGVSSYSYIYITCILVSPDKFETKCIWVKIMGLKQPHWELIPNSSTIYNHSNLYGNIYPYYKIWEAWLKLANEIMYRQTSYLSY